LKQTKPEQPRKDRVVHHFSVSILRLTVMIGALFINLIKREGVQRRSKYLSVGYNLTSEKIS
jgi:hypothetical protein